MCLGDFFTQKQKQEKKQKKKKVKHNLDGDY